MDTIIHSATLGQDRHQHKLKDSEIGGIVDVHFNQQQDGMLAASSESQFTLSKGIEADSDEDEKCSAASNDWDPVFEDIKKSLLKSDCGQSQTSSSSEHISEESVTYNVSEQFTSIPYGIQPRDAYEHGKKNTDIMGVTYNGRMRQFIILDAKGITTWKRDAVDVRVARSMSYPKYEYRLITYLVYAKKHNCYFALGKDFSLKVLNRDFFETCSVSADLRSILFMLFNPARDELITGGVGGAKVWHFHQSSNKSFQELKPLANYELSLKYELPNVGGSWVKHVDLDYHLEHLYCCSDTDLHVYDLQGKELFKFERAHTMSITGCRFSISSKVLVTSSLDTEVKVWSLTGGLVHTFRGHSRAITNLVVHPKTSSIIITCSLDGSLRMWSLDTMDVIYNLVVSASGLLWMGLTDDNLLYISTAYNITLWNLNHFIHFWSLTRSQITHLQLEGCPGKTQRVVAVGLDSSVRLFSRKDQKNLSTVLPPPSITPLQKILGVCYSREFNVIFVLVNPQSIWVYTTRTDPACRMAVWDVHQIQSAYLHTGAVRQERTAPSHRATENGPGNESVVNCCCVCILKSSAMVWTDEGCCCPIRHSYLLLGLEDGRVLFMDPVVKGQKYMEFKVSKDPVVSMHHDVDHKMLVTACQLTHMTYIQYWSLPDLELQHEVFCAPDLSAHAHIGYTCVTGHDSGHVLFFTLELANDPGPYKGRVLPEVDDIIDRNRRPEHQAAVITVDACITMKIFCSCSKDGAVKIWEETGTLLTEIMLDDSLSAACFLNRCADLIVAYRKHIFFIDHTKVCPHLKPEEEEDYTFDKESFIYEDPAVMYEGVTANPDPIDLDNYLVPYALEFSKDFLEGRLNLEPIRTSIEDSDEETEMSMAPTDVYISPPQTPDSLSQLDLTLESEVTKYDLKKQMKTTLQLLKAREQEVAQGKMKHPVLPSSDNKKSKSTEEKRKRKQGVAGLTSMTRTEKDQGTELCQKDEEEEAAKKETVNRGRRWRVVELPKFGVSPGPSPAPSPPSSPVTVAHPDEGTFSELEETDEDRVKEGLLPPKRIPDLELIAASGQQKAASVAGEKQEIISSAKRTRRGIADVEIDVKGLMKDHSHKPAATKKEADHAHITADLPKASAKEKTVKETTKKKVAAERKLPKRGIRPALPQEQDIGAGELTQVQKTEAGEKEADVSHVAEIQKRSEFEKSDHVSPVEEKKHGVRPPEMVVSSGDCQSAQLTSEGSPVADTTGVQDGKFRLEVPPLPSVLQPVSKAGDQPLSVPSAKTSLRTNPVGFPSNYISDGVRLSQTAEPDRKTAMVTSSASVNETLYDSGVRTPSIFSETDPNRTMSALSWTASKEEDPYSPVKGEVPRQATERQTQLQPRTIPFTPYRQGSVHIILPQVEVDVTVDSSGHIHKDPALIQTTSKSCEVPHAPLAYGAAELSSVLGEISPESGVISEGLASSIPCASPLKAEEQHRVWKSTGAHDTSILGTLRPATALLPTCQTDQGQGGKTRPLTATDTSFHREELRAAFEAALNHYQSHTSAHQKDDKLYVNSGTNFKRNWHERAIERHMLLRMQRILRAHAVQQRRQKVLEEQQQRRLTHLNEEQMGLPRNAMPAGAGSRKAGLPAWVHQESLTGEYPIFVHPPSSAPAPTPAVSRPHTASESRRIASLQLQQKKMQDLHDAQVWQEKHQLGSRQPYRFRIRSTSSEIVPSRPVTVPTDPWLLDPRNPSAVRPRSTKSIPSKCNRYVLLTKPRTGIEVPIPTPLEEDLIASRFPDQCHRLLQNNVSAFRLTHHSSHNIPYSPYVHPMY